MCGKKHVTVMAERTSKSQLIEFYSLGKPEKECYVAKLSLVGVDPCTLTASDLVEDIECLSPLK